MHTFGLRKYDFAEGMVLQFYCMLLTCRYNGEVGDVVVGRITEVRQDWYISAHVTPAVLKSSRKMCGWNNLVRDHVWVW